MLGEREKPQRKTDRRIAKTHHEESVSGLARFHEAWSCDLLTKPNGCESEFLTEFFWVEYSSSVNQDWVFHVLNEVFRREFLEFIPFGYEETTVSVS
jgi:hypothetical protein